MMTKKGNKETQTVYRTLSIQHCKYENKIKATGIDWEDTCQFFTMSISARSGRFDRFNGELPISGFVCIEYLLRYIDLAKFDHLK